MVGAIGSGVQGSPDGPGRRTGLRSISRCFNPASISSRRLLLRRFSISDGLADDEECFCDERVYGEEVWRPLERVPSLGGECGDELDPWTIVPLGRRSSAQPRMKVHQESDEYAYSSRVSPYAKIYT